MRNCHISYVHQQQTAALQRFITIWRCPVCLGQTLCLWAYLCLRWDDRSSRTGLSSHTCGMMAIIPQVPWADSRPTWGYFSPTSGRLRADFRPTSGQLQADFRPTWGRLQANFGGQAARPATLHLHRLAGQLGPQSLTSVGQPFCWPAPHFY